MKVAELLEKRRQYWQELETMIQEDRTYTRNWGVLAKFLGMFRSNARRPKMSPEQINRFATLYRAACADLALADAYHLPHNTIQYLHRLVGRAHNQLYRSKEFDLEGWATTLLIDVPRRIFHDRCVQAMSVIFWTLFLLSAYLAYSKKTWPDYAEKVLTQGGIAQLEEMYSRPIDGRNAEQNVIMAAFYIRHNTGIGLQCFTWNLLVVPGLYIVMYNATSLGAAFGYMARPDVPQGVNFFHFVRAHGPFELTAIVLAAGAGLRLGMAWISPRGLTRGSALRKAGRDAMPIMGASMVLFFLAALIEGFLSPSGAPEWLKSLVAVVTSGMLMFYFIVLGFPSQPLPTTVNVKPPAA